MNNKVLILFTSSFPFGHGEQFVGTELTFIAQTFSEICIFPYYYGNSKEMREGIPGNVKVFKPFRDEHHSLSKLIFKGIFNKTPLFPYFKDLFINPDILLSRQKLSLWFRSMLNCRMIMVDRRLRDCINRYHDRLLFYFYWGHRPSGITISLKKYKRPVVVRFHGTDLYREMELNRNYIPFRGIVLKSISHAVCISDHGASYIRRNYGSIPAHILVHRLGTLDHGTFRWDVAETLRIISCSIVDDNKRVGLIAQAIGNLNFPVRWTHIGDGPCMDDLLKQCRIMQNERIRIDLLGRIPNPKVHLIYQQEQFDLFINMSISEGIPFSIMEALSYSIPVIATAVGGIPEIINTACGQLMPVDLSVPDLKIQMEKYYLLSKDQKLVLRLNARKQWEQLCNAENNYRNFTVFLENL